MYTNHSTQYRPQRFADVGAGTRTQTLSNAIAQSRMRTSICCGPRGRQNEMPASSPSAELHGRAEGGFSDDDPRCQEITEDVDRVLEIDGASNNGVEQVRELRETVKYVPARRNSKSTSLTRSHAVHGAFNAC